ncbi:hypothetical protein KXD40_002377 [Peronospora effusa]|nr:hypothetical protein KXD40_002377 [Peronospora effusa]
MTVCRFFSQNLFNGFGNGISSQHVSLWCPDASISDDKELFNIMSNKRTMHRSGNITSNRECCSHATPCMKSTRHVKRLPPWKEVCSDDSTQEVHCGVTEQPDWREASSMTENSSWYSDSSGDTTKPWVARIYAWEDLGDRVGLPEDYCRPPIGEVKQSLHDLVIPNEFAGKSHTKEILLEIHEVDLIEVSQER